MANHVFSQLPEDLQIEIFSRVPAKSVGRFRCLSKKWNTILSSPYFVKLHLSRKTHQQSVILMNPDNNLLQIIDPPIKNPAISKQLQLVLENNVGWTKVMGSCNGLVLLMNSSNEMVVVNPVTLEQFKVPKLTFDSKYTHNLTVMHGFGYDSSSHDYKIVVVTSLFSVDLKYSSSADLYSVKSGVWKSIDHSPYNFNPSQTPSGVYANGSIHWYWFDSHKKKESDHLYKILAFDLATEGFHEVGSPLDVSGGLTLFAHEGRLCALNPLWKFSNGREKMNFWMTRVNGMANSWRKLLTISARTKYFMCKPLYFSSDKGILLAVTEKTMVLFNIPEGKFKDFVVDGVPTSCRDGCAFVGSLVSLTEIVTST